MKKICRISESELKRLYIENKLSIKQISKKLRCSYWKVWKSMKDFGIKARSLSEANTLNNIQRKISIPKKRLEELYLNKKLSVIEISNMYNCHHRTILRMLEENKIKRRDPVEANTRYPKKDFDGNEEEKAYLLAFALGDLNVRKSSQSGRTITIQCNSTISDQINLVDKLFRRYGLIKKSKVKTGFAGEENRISVNLNDSFNFLLYKKDMIPSWVTSNKDNFFAFLAGYIDAEGHISTKNTNYVQISSYDKGILNSIFHNLIRYGISCPKPRISARKGYSTKTKPSHYNKDMWRVGIYSKKSLSELFERIKPYLKHKKRVNAMLNSIMQIKERNR